MGGFVTRERHPTDRRAILVTLTSDGQRTARALAEDHQRLARKLFRNLPPDTVDGFDLGLEHVIAELRAVIRAAGPH